ncbi:MAG: 1-acyl-sn-glycerol-3-phosphate acyltransferase [Sphingobacteriaceae bacterium]|nr:1-acyl-sn-glycerol-3-phosphate acyltransferase [Sphingobacteriaceae bacterium]
MFYQILRFLFCISNKFYFKTFQVNGLENIPKKGPVFLAANHPSAFMDPLVIATISKRPLFMLAKGILFTNPMVKWFLSGLNIIPIYRSHETPELTGKNKDVFAQCYKHFAKGRAILAFPEGISLTERKIKKIQSGAARICLGAEAENNFSLDVKIVTIGLNFSNPHKFQSDLYINIDKPINVSDYYELYKKDTFKAAHALTDEIRKRLEAQVVAIQDSDVDKFVANIETIFKAQLLEDLGHSPKVMAHDFNTTRSISDSVHYFLERDPQRVEALKVKINSYLEQLDKLSLDDKLIKGVEKTKPVYDTILSLVFLILGLPIFLYGYINNILPFRIPFWCARIIAKRPEFHGSVAYSIGTLTFIVFYSLQIWLVSKFFGDWRIILAYGLSLPITGLLSFYYYNRFKSIRGSWKIFSLFYKKTTLMTSLIAEREIIITELEKARREFVAWRDAPKTETLTTAASENENSIDL